LHKWIEPKRKNRSGSARLLPGGSLDREGKFADR